MKSSKPQIVTEITNAATDRLLTVGTVADNQQDLNSEANLTFDGSTLTVTGDLTVSGTTPLLTIGDAGEEDTMIVFDGNAQDYRIGLDDGTDNLEIGVGAAHGTTPALTIDSNTDIEVYGGIGINSDIADEKVSGITAVFTAGEDMTAGDVCFFDTDGKMYKANHATGQHKKLIVAMAVETFDVSAEDVGKFLLQGFARFEGNFPTFTIGEPIYGPEAEGAPQNAAPSDSGDLVQVLGWAITSDMVFFNPSMDIIEVA